MLPEQVFVREVGKGSIGRVHLGHWRETSVAIKSLTPVLEATVRKRLSTENRSLESNQPPAEPAPPGPQVHSLAMPPSRQECLPITCRSLESDQPTAGQASSEPASPGLRVGAFISGPCV